MLGTFHEIALGVATSASEALRPRTISFEAGRGSVLGRTVIERENAKHPAPGIEQLYAGTRLATLHRYGETDDKTKEVI